MKHQKLIPFIIFCGITDAAQAQTLYYSQTFNATETSVLGDYGWLANHGDMAEAYDVNMAVPDLDETPIVAASTSGGGDDSGNGTANGYIFHSRLLNKTDRTIWWTNDFTPFDVSTFHSIQVDVRTDVDNENMQFAFQVDGSTAWHRAEVPLLNSSAGDEWSNNETLNIASLTSSDLSILNVNPGVDFSTGADVTMPTTGNVTAVGIYNYDIDNSVRFDNFEVYVIPEPADFTLLAGLIGLSGLLLRRRFTNH